MLIISPIHEPISVAPLPRNRSIFQFCQKSSQIIRPGHTLYCICSVICMAWVEIDWGLRVFIMMMCGSNDENLSFLRCTNFCGKRQLYLVEDRRTGGIYENFVPTSQKWIVRGLELQTKHRHYNSTNSHAIEMLYLVNQLEEPSQLIIYTVIAEIGRNI